MAFDLRGRRARRRLAAIAFLSKISLNGAEPGNGQKPILKRDTVQYVKDGTRRVLYQRRLRQAGRDYNRNGGSLDESSPSGKSRCCWIPSHF